MKARFEFEVGLRAEAWLGALVALAVGYRRAPQVIADLMTGIQTKTTETNEKLWLLSRQVKQEPALAEAVAEGRFDSVGATPSGRDFLATLDRFLVDYGHREGATWYLSTPTWRADRTQIWQLMRGLLEVDQPPRQGGERYDEARRLVERRLRYLPGMRKRFQWLLERLRALQKFREDSHFDLARPLAALQEVAAEWGKRLVDRGLLQQQDEVFLLTGQEVRDWLGGKAPQPEGARRHIKRREATYRVMNDRWQSRLPQAQTGNDLKGIPASAGIVRARARLIRGEKEWSRLRRGEIMVCPYTNPAWTPLFAIAAAVITETGGATAHAAIVAREYGIPAVMSVPGATHRIADGQELLVDGRTGRVVLGDPPERATRAPLRGEDPGCPPGRA